MAINGEVRSGIYQSLTQLTTSTTSHADNFNFLLKALIDNDVTLEELAKQYTDTQIANIVANGVPKLVTYAYLLGASQNGQKDFDIPLSTFSPTTDTVSVVQNRSVLGPNDYTIGDFNGDGIYTVRLKEGVTNAPPTEIFIRVFKNVPIGPAGSINGNVIADGTLSISKLDTAAQKRIRDLEVLELWGAW